MKSKRIAFVSSLVSLITGIAFAQNLSQQSLELFPVTVIEDISETTTVAAQIENDLQSIIPKMEEDQELYTQLNCFDRLSDEECSALSRSLLDQYSEMLEVLRLGLPEMARTISQSKRTLESRLGQKVGRELSPRNLQKMLLDDSSGTPTILTSRGSQRPPGRSGLSLSERFANYHRLVSSSQRLQNSSLVVTAANIYLDMEGALQLSEIIQQEIQRTQLVMKLEREIGRVTPEMYGVVASVKSIIFGEDATPIAGAPSPPVVEGSQAWQSPLEF